MRVAHILGLVVAFFFAYALATFVDTTLGMFVFLASAGAFIAWRLWSVQRGAHTNNRGLTLLGEGRLTEAIALFEEARRIMGRNPLPRFNLGVANLWLWRLADAETLIDSSTKTLQGRPLRLLALPMLQFISAVKNERARFEERTAELAKLNNDRSPMSAMARAVFAARAGDWAGVSKELSLERTRPLGGPSRSVADALRGWANVQRGGRAPAIDAVGVFGETGPTAVAAWWPEFAKFVQENATPD